jgi:hypothetical protein
MTKARQRLLGRPDPDALEGHRIDEGALMNHGGLPQSHGLISLWWSSSRVSLPAELQDLARSPASTGCQIGPGLTFGHRANRHRSPTPFIQQPPNLTCQFRRKQMSPLPAPEPRAAGGTEGSNPCTLQSGYRLVGIVDWPDRAGLPGVAHESPCFEHLERTCTPAGRPRRKSRGRLRFERQYRD